MKLSLPFASFSHIPLSNAYKFIALVALVWAPVLTKSNSAKKNTAETTAWWFNSQPQMIGFQQSPAGFQQEGLWIEFILESEEFDKKSETEALP